MYNDSDIFIGDVDSESMELPSVIVQMERKRVADDLARATDLVDHLRTHQRRLSILARLLLEIVSTFHNDYLIQLAMSIVWTNWAYSLQTVGKRLSIH